jgi:hypothetical protein
MKRLLFLGVLLVVPYTLLWRLNDWDRHIPLFLTLYFCAFILYGIAVRLALKKKLDNIPRITVVIWLVALAIRALLLFQGPNISEDFYRYVWDGRVQLAGFGPYDHPPQDPEVQGLKDQYYERMHQKEFRSPYPPAAEDLFRLIALLYPNLLLCKLAILSFDLLVIECVRRLLRRTGLSPATLLIYAWHPLPVIEFASGAHMDIMGIGLMMLTLLLMEYNQRSAAGISFTAAILVKILPVFALPWLWRKGGWRFVLVAVLTGVVFVLQFYTPDLRILKGLLVYYEIWRYNDSMFGLFYYWFGTAEQARNISMYFMWLVAAWCFASGYPIYRSIFVTFAAVLLFSPVVHPWYVCWVIPFLALHPNRTWIFWTGWVAVSYLIRYLFPDGNWQEVLWLKLLIYVPLYSLLIFDLWRAMTSPKHQATRTTEVSTS